MRNSLVVECSLFRAYLTSQYFDQGHICYTAVDIDDTNWTGWAIK